MNSLNDLIQSHNMYDAMEEHAHRPDTMQTPPPSASYTTNTQHQALPDTSIPQHPYPPQYQQQRPAPSHMTHQQVQPYQQQPIAMPQQTYATDQERYTMHTMMREISLMQRRLSGMITSLEAMMERTEILHEYHHIARYRSERAAAAHTSATLDPQYSTPSFNSYQAQENIGEFSHQAAQQQYRRDSSYNEQLPNEQRQNFTPPIESPMSIKEGVFNGTHMISAEGDIYAIPVSFLCEQKLIEGDIMQAMVFASGQIKYKLSEPTPREHIMGILSTHSGTSPFYIVQTANKAYNVLKEAVELAQATPGKQILLTVPAGGESEWATIEKVFS